MLLALVITIIPEFYSVSFNDITGVKNYRLFVYILSTIWIDDAATNSVKLSALLDEYLNFCECSEFEGEVRTVSKEEKEGNAVKILFNYEDNGVFS